MSESYSQALELRNNTGGHSMPVVDSGSNFQGVWRLDEGDMPYIADRTQRCLCTSITNVFCCYRKEYEEAPIPLELEDQLERMIKHNEVFTMCFVWRCNLKNKTITSWGGEIYLFSWLSVHLLYIAFAKEGNHAAMLFLLWVIMMFIYMSIIAIRGPAREMVHYTAILVDCNWQQHGLSMTSYGIQYLSPEKLGQMIDGRGRIHTLDTFRADREACCEEICTDFEEICPDAYSIFCKNQPTNRKYEPLLMCDSLTQTYKDEELQYDEIGLNHLYFLLKEESASNFIPCGENHKQCELVRVIELNNDKIVVMELRTDNEIEVEAKDLRAYQDMVHPQAILDLARAYPKYDIINKNCHTFASELLNKFHGSFNLDQLSEITGNALDSILEEFGVKPDPDSKYFLASRHRDTCDTRQCRMKSITIYSLIRVIAIVFTIGFLIIARRLVSNQKSDIQCEAFPWDCTDLYVGLAVMLWVIFSAAPLLYQWHPKFLMGEFSGMEQRTASYCHCNPRRKVRIIKQKHWDHATELIASGSLGLSPGPMDSLSFGNVESVFRSYRPLVPTNNQRMSKKSLGGFVSGLFDIDSHPVIKRVEYEQTDYAPYLCCGRKTHCFCYAIGVWAVYASWFMICFLPFIFPIILISLCGEYTPVVAGTFALVLILATLAFVIYQCQKKNIIDTWKRPSLEECLEKLIPCGPSIAQETSLKQKSESSLPPEAVRSSVASSDAKKIDHESIGIDDEEFEEPTSEAKSQSLITMDLVAGTASETVKDIYDQNDIKDIISKGKIGIYFGTFEHGEEFIKRLIYYEEKEADLSIIFVSFDENQIHFEQDIQRMPARWFAMDHMSKEWKNNRNWVKYYCGSVSEIPLLSIFESGKLTCPGYTIDDLRSFTKESGIDVVLPEITFDEHVSDDEQQDKPVIRSNEVVAEIDSHMLNNAQYRISSSGSPTHL